VNEEMRGGKEFLLLLNADEQQRTRKEKKKMMPNVWGEMVYQVGFAE